MKARFLTAVLILGVLFGAANECYAWPLPELPTAELECPNNAVVGDRVLFDGSGSKDNDEGGESIVKYEWDFDYNDVVGFDCDYSETPSPPADCNFDGKTTHTYSELGDYKVILKVTDDEGQWDYSSAQDIHVCRIVNITQDSNDPNIQTAIDNASPGDTIVVAEGTYTGPGNRDIEFNGLAITVRSIDPNDADVVAATVIDCNGSPSEPNRGFYFHSSETANSVLAGFTITNGYVTSSSPGGAYGGGIYCDGASPTITSCIFSGNLAATYLGDGGGMHNENSSPTVTNCIFRDNTAVALGGGMNNYLSSPKVTGCFFEKNNANFGGGMRNRISSATVFNCVFSKNKAYSSSGGSGGGMYNSSNSSLTVVNCAFSKNKAKGNGGGFVNSSNGSLTLSNCILWGNTASNYPQIYDDGTGSVTVTYSDVQDGWDGEENINADPCFANAAIPAGPDGIFGTIDDGLFLRTDSPCIDEGNNVAVEDTGVTTDIIGNPRIVDGNHAQEDGIWATVDMGAYELPVIWYVDASAPGNDGKSWATAYLKLQDALNNQDITDGNEIWVADGNYYPDEGSVQTPNDREASFVLTEGAGVYGGFDSGETARIDRDWTLYEATLSGDINMPDSNDNSYHVVTGADRAVLDGFTITDGNANGSDANSHGGGIYCYETSPIISNCTIADNYSIGDGGGIYCYRASPQFSDCVIIDNYSFSAGAGMYNDGGIEDRRFPTVTNCFFIDNKYGGMVNYYCCGWQMLITNCVFSGNDDYGIFNDVASSPILINCTFAKNLRGMLNGFSDPTVINCIFWANTDREIYNRSSNPTFSYCDVNGCGGSDNWDDSFGADGGGNIDSDPYFVDIDNPAGQDANFSTWDDGLRLTRDSNCIDAADGNAAPATDILGHGRIEVYNVDNNGAGEPNYADIGAYEFRDGGIVVMVWIDESTTAYHKLGGDVTFETDLVAYRELLNSGDLSIVKSGCLVPLESGQPNTDGWITDVLPFVGYPPPREISIEECRRFPNEDEKVAQFNRIRDGVVPDYLLLSVDNSGSMSWTDIWPLPSPQDAYDSFKARIKAIPGMADIVIAPEPRSFGDEQWIAEMTAMLQEL